MTEVEKTALDAPAVAEAERVKALKDSITTKLKGLGFDDSEITYLLNTGI